MLSCLWGQVDFRSKKWLRGTGKKKQLNLKEGQILQVSIKTHLS